MGLLIILLIIIGIILLLSFVIYNSLIRIRNKVKNAWAQIDVQLKKRYDLVPNLIKTVKGYAKHEKQTLNKITEMRSEAIKAESAEKTMKLNNKMSKAIEGLMVNVENYPDLKASQNFLMLQEELSGIENKIAYARQYYNDSIMKYNNKIQMFPTNICASLFGFKEKEFLETREDEKKNVKVSF